MKESNVTLKTSPRFARALLLRAGLLGLVGFLALPALGVSPAVWRSSSYSEFSSGEAENVSTLNPGEIRLAPSFDLFAKVPESGAWSLAESKDGKTLYVGTGNRARVYKIAVEADAATGEAELFADLDGNAVYALLRGADGFLYAGVSPGGKVFKIGPDGAVTLHGDSKQNYIWSMVFDATGDLVLATGDKGALVRMDKEGEPKEILKTEEKHLLSLVSGKDGEFYFGTAPSGWVCVLDNKGDFRALYDSELSEVKALALDEAGDLYAGIVPTLKVDPKNDNPQAASAPKPKTNSGSELVRISPSGLTRVLFKTKEETINAIHPNGDGLILGTGDKGKALRLGYRDNADMISDLEAGDLLVFENRKSGGAWLGTANPGSVVYYPEGAAKTGVYASDPLDTKVASAWGRFSWIASTPEGATLDFQTRSGNTKKPDDNWSDWSDPLVEPGAVSSPPARFLQWRARFGGSDDGDSASVRETEIVYQKLNQPPRIKAVKVGNKLSSSGNGGAKDGKSTAGDAAKGGSAAKSGAKANGGSSSLALAWQAEDGNGDGLIYDLHFRRVGENLWKELKTDITAVKHTWPLTSLPDGDYEVQLTASDRRANPKSSAQEDRWSSEPVRVDTTAPEVGEWKDGKVDGKTYTVRIEVSDNLSRLVEVDRVVDGDIEKPVPVLPDDGILDTTTEVFSIELEDLESGEHSLTVRAKDELGNIGAGSVVFDIP